MKKRILSILLTLCMVSCLVPTTVFAADTRYGVWIEGGRDHLLPQMEPVGLGI